MANVANIKVSTPVNRLVGDMPKIGIRPAIDGRCRCSPELPPRACPAKCRAVGGADAPDQNQACIEREAANPKRLGASRSHGAPDKWKRRYNLRLAIGYRGRRTGSNSDRASRLS